LISKQILARVRQIEIRARKWVNAVFSGEYESIFKGRGMEFDDVREYFPGDDVRSIDWNVTARTGFPHVKKFVEERELTVMLVVDMSSSGRFGTRNRLKIDMAVEISALLAFSAIKNNDRVGLVIFTDRVELFIPPKKGRRHVLRLVRELLSFTPARPGTDLAGVLEYLNKSLKRRAIVFLLSDFLSGGYEKPLAITNRKHDVVALMLSDPAERSLPGVGVMNLEDAETGRESVVDTGDRAFRQSFSRRGEKLGAERLRTFRSIDLDHVELATDKDYIVPLIGFFRERMRRFR
jgi:uncharacterized protein (DUF58 family)